ncbi:hypothetical protein J6A31_09210 [bacterium]|nr:hypothetical protein [bacterium]
MSTPCNIGIINYDDSVDVIYCHWDGYPSYQTQILLTDYNTEQKVRELINLGDISMLGSKVTPDTNSHSFTDPEPDTVIAYHRDRKDKWEETKPKHFKNKRELKHSYYRQVYIYLFDSKTGLWSYTSNERFKVLGVGNFFIL